ncbi:MAG: PAS domain S-box protein, partial [Ferruginibacter sp.]|nr:PAS domain S-box protein [Rhodoferax sp.]
MSRPRAWRLRSYLAALLVVTSLVTFAIVGTSILLVRIPQIERANQNAVERETIQVAERVDVLLGALAARMELLGAALEGMDLAEATRLLERAALDGKAIRAIYLASNDGKVLAAGVVPALRVQGADLLGSDLSASPLFREALASRQMVWGDKFLSALSGVVTVGLAYPVGRDRVLLAEVPLAYLLDTFALAAGKRTASVWLVDRTGEIVADTDHGRHVSAANVLNSPLIQAALNFQTLPELFSFEGRSFHPAVARSEALDWYFMGGIPAGLENQDIRTLVVGVVAAFAGALLVGLLMAPFWASWLTRPLRGIVARAGQTTRGAVGGPWPRGPIAEFNLLSSDIEKMADTLQERELKSQAIFNASPVPMSVTDADRDFVLLDVNQAWCSAHGFVREDVLGRTAIDIGLLPSSEVRDTGMTHMHNGSISMEGTLNRANGQPVLCQVFGRQVHIGDAHLLIWATIDISDMRRISNELRELNTELEHRVQRRTQALATANQDLSGAMVHLRETQGELVRVEKMAALGGLVAGVAHELNTPLGNSLMAVTALADEVRQFRTDMQAGLHRSALESLLDSVAQATDIAARNLHRAADLVTSFKQVAADQTSAQRRPFELREVVDEMVASLRPTFARTPYKIQVEVPVGLRLDSFPGALGQAIGNLVHNAVLHGFDGRAHGTVRITGERDGQGMVVLRVADDGHGIPANLLDRIFDPFVTTKMGRGGTGLGLHIAFNAVSNVLGGSLTVHSEEG